MLIYDLYININNILLRFDTSYFCFVKDAFKMCVPSEHGLYGKWGCPFKSGHANFERGTNVVSFTP